MISIGHRGAKGYRPENTLSSIQKALELGIRFIEIDVYNVEDELVVIHDHRYERTTNGTGYVQSQSFDYLRSLDAGEGERIPTLFEVCQLIESKACLNIELKGPNTAAPVCAFVQHLTQQGWNKNSFLISSFDHRQLVETRELDDEVLLGALMCGMPVDDAKFAQDLSAFSVHPSIEFIDQRYVDDAQARGLKVYAYTANYPEDIVLFSQMGVDGLFSDYPDRVSNAIEQPVFRNSWT